MGCTYWSACYHYPGSQSRRPASFVNGNLRAGAEALGNGVYYNPMVFQKFIDDWAVEITAAALSASAGVTE